MMKIVEQVVERELVMEAEVLTGWMAPAVADPRRSPRCLDVELPLQLASGSEEVPFQNFIPRLQQAPIYNRG